MRVWTFAGGTAMEMVRPPDLHARVDVPRGTAVFPFRTD